MKTSIKKITAVKQELWLCGIIRYVLDQEVGGSTLGATMFIHYLTFHGF